MFKTIESKITAELTEKKSRFIANIFPINSEEEAKKILRDMKKKYYDAKHNCYAYILDNVQKCSDDGEPSGTAGLPLLDLLKNEGLKNIIIVVTRYFGGILLGTGGLVRAYTEVAKKGLEKANIIEMEYGIRYLIEISYNNINNLKYLCKNLKIDMISIEYGENVVFILQSNLVKKNELEKSNINIINKRIDKENVILKMN